MNGRCETCDVEKQCAYEYKPTECCNYRKFKPYPTIDEELDGGDSLNVNKIDN